MKKPFLAALFVLLINPSVATAQSVSPDQSLHDELAQINASLKEIAQSLKQQAEGQKADLLLKRVMLASTQLSVAEEQLRRIDQEVRTLRDQSAEFETILKMLQARTPSSEAANTAGRDQIAETNSRIKNTQERLGTLSQERIGAENDIERLRREAREWQALLDKFLTSRP